MEFNEYHRVVSPFLCSTEDFSAERAYLNKHIFPKLAQLFKERGACFKPYIWDDQLSMEQLERGNSLQLAFDCIKRSSPYFIGLLGDQYGLHRHLNSALLPKRLNDVCEPLNWIDKSFLIAAECGYDWILSEIHQTSSLLELQVTQAAFLCEENEFCHFYVRDLCTDVTQSQVQIAQGPTSLTSHDQFKIRALKTNIAKRGLSVKYFKTLEELGQSVYDDWVKVADTLFPAFNADNISLETQIETVEHLELCARLAVNYVRMQHTDRCMNELTKFATTTVKYPYSVNHRAMAFEKATGLRLLKKEKHSQEMKKPMSAHKSVCVLTGSRGCGKSALVSNWLNSDARSSLHPKVKIIFHSFNKCTMSRNVVVFMKRCISELRQHFCTNYDDRFAFDEPYESFSQICETFLAACNLGPCFLILDGLNQLAASMEHSIVKLKQMNWLPNPLPPCCKILFTVTSSDYSVRSLRCRSDTIFISHPDISNLQNKTAILKDLTGDFSHELSVKTIDKICGFKLSSSPIYLSLMAHEVRDYHVRRDLDAHLEAYACLNNINVSFKDFWSLLLKRWVRDYSWSRYSEDISKSSTELQDVVICGWVPDALRLIACSRNGLRVQEILGTLEYGMGYTGDNAITLYDWEAFYSAARSVFYEKPDGLIAFSHGHFTEVIDFLLLGNVTPAAVHETSADFQSMQKLGGMERRQYHISLASHLMSMPASDQLWRIDEILWQLEIACDYVRLGTTIAIPQVFSYLHGFRGYQPLRTELLRFWKLVKSKKVDVNQKVKKQLTHLGVDDHDKLLKEGESEAGQDCKTITDDLLTSVPQTPRSQLKGAWMEHGPSMSDINLASADNMSDNAFLDTFSQSSLGINIRDNGTPCSLESNAFDDSDALKAPPRIIKEQVITGSNIPLLTPVAIPGTRLQSVHSSEVNESAGLTRINVSEAGDLQPEPITIVMLNQLPFQSVDTIQMSIAVSELLCSVGEQEEGKAILRYTVEWLTQRYPLSSGELELLCELNGRIADTELKAGNIEAAQIFLERANNSLFNCFTSDKPKSKQLIFLKAKLLTKLGHVQLLIGNLGSAADVIIEALVGMQDIKCIMGENRAIYQLGILQSLKGDYVKATDCLQKCLVFFEEWHGCMNPLIAEISHMLGVMLFEENNLENGDPILAEECLWKALHIRRELDSNSLDAADTLFQLGFHLQKDGTRARKKEAVELLENCLDIRTKILGNGHKQTKIVTYLLNDLEISLKLGQFMFGEAPASDNRNSKVPLSELTMHEHQLAEYHEKISKSQSYVQRPKSAYNVAQPRCESRLQKTINARPKTAPSRLRSERVERLQIALDRPKSIPYKTVTNETGSPLATAPSDYVHRRRISESSSCVPTPDKIQHPNSFEAQLQMVGKNPQLLKKYAEHEVDRHIPTSGKPRKRRPATAHRCFIPGPHSIYKELNTVSVGPHCSLASVAGPPPFPRSMHKPIHKSAWYHMPNHYTTADKPLINLRVYTARNKLLSKQFISKESHV